MVDINYTGDLGQTALHFCVLKNSHNSLEKLLSHSPSLYIADRNGAFAVHAAATHASSTSLEVLLNHASITTNDRQKLLTLLDKEGNTALHAAVNSGDLRTVEVCLDNGSQIDVQQ
nr:transient receptor potential cation channel subfamily A member 1 [Apostichopus japonicus]